MSGGGGALEKQLGNQLDCWWRAKGGVDERGKRGPKRQDRRRRTMTAMPVFDDDGNDGIAVRRTGRSPPIRRRCARYLITPSWWGRCGAQSSVAPPSSSVEHCCRRGEGPGLVGGDFDRGPRSGAHERFGVHADPRCSGNDDDDSDDDNEDDYDYTTGDLSSLAASFGDGVGADAQIPADISW